MPFTPTFRRLGAFILFFVVGVILFGTWSTDRSWKSWKQNGISQHDIQLQPNKLHFVIPATSSNRYLCQLLLSATILGYPEPVVVNWGTPEDHDDYIQHLAKVDSILNFLNTLGPHQDDELFLMVDGYDAWFQLPPDILIERYHSVVAASKTRYSHNSWHSAASPVDTVIFGQDKICWPGTPSRAACWAVPDSPLHPQAFGPDTDRAIGEHNRPRWLNSGTIMGPVKDVRAVFAATLAKIHAEHIENSDQFYFANVFAEQSFARGPTKTQRWPDLDAPVEEGHEPLEIPNVTSTQRSELGIGIDYTSALFQTVAYYEAYITWIRHNQSSNYMSTALNPYNRFNLPAHLRTSSPFSIMGRSASTLGLDPALDSWSTVPLGTNTITKEVFPIIHFTGKKGYREMWWRRNWFYGDAERMLRLRRAARKGAGDVVTTGAGILRWEEMCGRFEGYLFGSSV